jgi:peptidoglycan/LPS O-acetylase OafA/YrhL
MHGEDKIDTARILQLDGLRAFAVLMVFVSHAFRSQPLWSGVDLFFILSGFLITVFWLSGAGRQLSTSIWLLFTSGVHAEYFLPIWPCLG